MWHAARNASITGCSSTEYKLIQWDSIDGMAWGSCIVYDVKCIEPVLILSCVQMLLDDGGAQLSAEQLQLLKFRADPT